MIPDRDKLIEELEWHTIGRSRRKGDKYVVTLELRFANSILDLLRSQPQVVRCNDCKYYNSGGIDKNGKPFRGCCTRSFHSTKGDDWFCADGERR